MKTMANVFRPIFWGLVSLSVPWSLARLISDLLEGILLNGQNLLWLASFQTLFPIRVVHNLHS